MKPMKHTHRATEDQHEVIRNKAREIAAMALPVIMTNSSGQAVNTRAAVNLSAIDFRARAQAGAWHSSPFRRVD